MSQILSLVLFKWPLQDTSDIRSLLAGLVWSERVKVSDKRKHAAVKRKHFYVEQFGQNKPQRTMSVFHLLLIKVIEPLRFLFLDFAYSRKSNNVCLKIKFPSYD